MRKNILFSTLFLFISIVGVYAVPPKDVNPEQMRVNLEKRMTEYLQLTDKQIKEVFPLFQEWHEKRIFYKEQTDSLGEYLYFLIKYEQKDTKKIEKLVKSIIDIDRKNYEMNEEMETKIMSKLTTIQKARFLLWKHREINREKIKNKPPIKDHRPK